MVTTAEDVDLSGRTALVTGANSGVGRATTSCLARSGATVVMVCRHPGRGKRALEELERRGPAGTLELELCDLSDVGAASALGRRIEERHARLDIVVNNAGAFRGRREVTADGLEVTFATNHLGHFALTLALLGPLREARGRIVNVSSDGHGRGDLRRADLEAIARGEAWRGGLQAYCDSKLANVLFTLELDRRYRDAGVTSNALHPGVLATRIWNQSRHPGSLVMRPLKLFMKPPDAGGRAVFRLAADPALVETSGRYFDVETEAPAAPMAYDEALAERLWDLSLRLTERGGGASRAARGAPPSGAAATIGD